MFGIGFTEFLVIGIIALLVVGPEKLPELAQKLGRFAWEMRRAWDDVRDTMRTEFSEVSEPLKELRSAGKNYRGKIDSELRKFKEDTDRSLKESAESLNEAARGKGKEAAPKKAPETAGKTATGNVSDKTGTESSALQGHEVTGGKPRSDKPKTENKGAETAAAPVADEAAGSPNAPSGTVASEHPFRRATKQASKITYFDLDGNPITSSPDK